MTLSIYLNRTQGEMAFIDGLYREGEKNEQNIA